MSTLSEEQLRIMPFIFCQCLLDNPRVLPAELGRKVGVCRKTAKDYLNEFFKKKVLFPPQMRLKNGKEVTEYVYLLKVKNPYSFFSLLSKYKWIFYGCVLSGTFNIIFTSYQQVDLSCEKGYISTVLSGARSNYAVPEVKEKKYESAYSNIMKMCNKKIDLSMLDLGLQDVKWTDELWELYCDLKYDLRIDFTPLVKKYEFKKTTFYDRIQRLMMNTDVYVPLYPLEERSYQFFYFLWKTDYQQFIVDSFGQLPVSTSHIRVKDSLLSYIPVPYGGEREHFLNIISLWERKGIIDSFEMSIPFFSDLVNIHPGIPLPAPPVPSPSGVNPPSTLQKTGKERMLSI